MHLLHTVHAKACVHSIHTFMHQKKQRDQTAANPKQAKHEDREPGARVYGTTARPRVWDKADKKIGWGAGGQKTERGRKRTTKHQKSAPHVPIRAVGA